ncbi:MAG: protein kinase [Myxococcales bacterium]|nr:protein kinase [Myxococcales bacterium]
MTEKRPSEHPTLALSNPQGAGAALEQDPGAEKRDDATAISAPPTPDMPKRSPAPSVPPQRRTVLANRYELRGLLGSGGMGTVYLASDLDLEEDVALKLLRREALDTPGALERFRREVKLARRVTHPNVSRTYDIASHEDDFFITMEYVAGQTLASRGASTRFTPPQVAAIAVEICKGLEAAHQAGVIHRDLKPQNIMLERPSGPRRARVVIMDFGIAQAAQVSAGQLTTMGQLVGTPAYMAPEQLSGLAVDPRADLYALGVMLFELLTGQLPWSGDSPISTALARLRTEAPDPRLIDEEIPAELAELTNRCLAREASARPDSALEVLEALEQWQETELGSAGLAPTLVFSKQRTAADEPAHSLSPPSSTLASASGDPRPGTLRSRDVQMPSLSSAKASMLHTPFPSVLTPASGAVVTRDRSPSDGLGSTTPGETRSVAVVPFDTRGNGDLDYLAEGLAEEIIDLLSMTRGLRVRPLGSVVALRRGDAEADSRALGAALGVEVVVEGSISQLGTQYVLRARVVGVADGFQLWANRHRADASELLDMSESVARAVAEALTTPSSGIAPRRAPTDPRALDLYFRGRHEYKKLDPSSALKAVELFEQAVELAPEDPAILSGRALAHARHWFFGGVGTADLARQSAELAVSQAPDRAEPHLALATVALHEGDAVAAVKHAKQALRLAPALADAHAVLGRLLAETGPADVARAHLASAEELDPSVDEWRWIHARLEALMGNWEQCEALLHDVPAAPSIGGWLHVARTSIWHDARDVAERSLSHPSLRSPEYAVVRRLFQFLLDGRRDLDVDSIFNPALGSSHSSSRGSAFRHQVRCELLATQGQEARAVIDLAHAVDAGLIDLVWLERCPLLTQLRSRSEFEPLRRRVAERASAVSAALA